MAYTAEDRKYMKRAIELGHDDKRKFHVGAVIVKDGSLLAEAHGDANMKEHAELRAINQVIGARKSVVGATIYTTLEPCVPSVRSIDIDPCTTYIVTHGLARVVIGVLDPNPDVTRQGYAELQRHGLEVELCRDIDLLREIRTMCKLFFQERWPRYEAYPGFDLDRDFKGRVHERELLSRWLSRHGEYRGQSIGNKPILVLHGLGGMGKSNLTWLWTKRDVADKEVPIPSEDKEVKARCCVQEGWKPDRALWFSFYKIEGGGDFQRFLDEAIRHFSAGTLTRENYAVAGDRVDYPRLTDNLFDILATRRCLIVWDGAERLLVEYSGEDPLLSEHRDLEEIKHDSSALKFSALEVSQFLRRLASQSNSKLLIASRLPLTELQHSAGAVHIELKGLDPTSAVGFLLARGVRGETRLLQERAAWYGYHPLSLSNLAAALLDDFGSDGNILNEPQFDPGMPTEGRRRHILKLAFERRAKQRQELLSRIAAVRGPVTDEIIRLLGAGISRVDDTNVESDMNVLIRHGLVSRVDGADQYVLHPVIRHYAYGRLNATSRMDCHEQLRDYFGSAAALVNYSTVETIQDLSPVIEFYYHTVRYGDYDGACKIYYAEHGSDGQSLNKLLHYKLSRHQTVVELLALLFPKGLDADPEVSNEEKSRVLNDLALGLRGAGNLQRAVNLATRKLAVDVARAKQFVPYLGAPNVELDIVQVEMLRRIAHALETSGQCLLRLGRLVEAHRDLVTSADNYLVLLRLLIAQGREALMDHNLGRVADSIWLGHSIVSESLGELSACMGRFDEAENLVRLSARGDISDQRGLTQALALVDIGLMSGDVQLAEEQAALAKSTLEAISPESAFDSLRARVSRALGSVLTARGDYESAESRLKDALHICRAVRDIEGEGKALIQLGTWAHARWLAAPGANQESILGDVELYASEALTIAQRSGYALIQADAHNLLAAYWMDKGDLKRSSTSAANALAAAACGVDPKHSDLYYAVAYDLAQLQFYAASD